MKTNCMILCYRIRLQISRFYTVLITWGLHDIAIDH